MELGLKGRRVLITGGSQGIGYSVAEGFLEEGCSVVIASKSEERLRSAMERLSKYGRERVRGEAIDLSLPGAARHWPMPTARRTFSSTTLALSRQEISLRLTKSAGARRGTSRCSATSI
jgi:NAD(P)-dependent dehydrogenase (short-subunit alcohol dehydrogenase family)